MAGGSDGYRVALVMRHLTPGLISSSPGTAGLPPFIAFSTSYPKLDSMAAAGIETWSRRNQSESRFHLSIVVAKIMQIPAHYALRNFDALGVTAAGAPIPRSAMSAFGTKQTSWSRSAMSAFGSKADMALTYLRPSSRVTQT
jgi:hypothetical protein